MPLYFFNLEDHVRDVDDEGSEFPDLEQARVAGVVFAGEYLSDHPELIRDGRKFVVDVRDEADRPVIKITVLASNIEGDRP